MANTFDTAEARYPWVEGFDAMLDLTAEAVTGTAASRKALLRRLGIWACADDMCGTRECSVSSAAIQEEQGFSDGNDADRFAAGARAALGTITAVKSEVVYV